MHAAALKNYWSRLRHKLHWDDLSPGLRRTLAGVIGGTVLLIGVALIFLPGPAFVVIPVGMAILATEFAWARRCLLKAQQWFHQARTKFSHR